MKINYPISTPIIFSQLYIFVNTNGLKSDKLRIKLIFNNSKKDQNFQDLSSKIAHILFNQLKFISRIVLSLFTRISTRIFVRLQSQWFLSDFFPPRNSIELFSKWYAVNQFTNSLFMLLITNEIFKNPILIPHLK